MQTLLCARLFVVFIILCSLCSSARIVMPWMCLERCGDSKADIQDQLAQIANNRNLFSAVSFEMYNLGANGALEANNLTDVHGFLTQLGIQTIPMVSSYPYPPEFLDWMRQLWQTPTVGDSFIAACIDALDKHSLSGLNIDWEPSTPKVPPTAQDAADYAAFLDKISRALHKVDKIVTVDVSSWSVIWNWTLIAKTSVDRIFMMDTYTRNFTIWKERLHKGIDEIGFAKLAVGLEPSSNLTLAETAERFETIATFGGDIQTIGLWRTGIPSEWLPFIYRFLNDS